MLKILFKTFLLSKTFDDVGSFAPILAPQQFVARGGAGQRYLFEGRGGAGWDRVEKFQGRGAPGQPFPPGRAGAGRGEACIPGKNL